MFTRYRAVLAVPGALRFSATSFVARLPIAVETLGIVLLATGLSHSYGYAGALSAAFTIANSAASVVQGRLLDRLGQAVVLPVAAVTYGVAVLALVLGLEWGWPSVLIFTCSVVSGAAYPPIGSAVRARWSFVLAGRPADVQTAYALESVIDEVIFIVGPTTATVLATQWHAWAGLGIALVTGVPGTLYLASQTATQPRPQRTTAEVGPRPPMPWRPVVLLAAVSLALGSMFAGAEVSTVAFASEHHEKAFAGVLLACWSSGSLLAGLLTGTIRWRRPPAYRVRAGSAFLCLAMIPTTLVTSIPAMGLSLFVAGVAIAPTLIATMAAIEQLVPGPRLTEGIAIIHTGIAAGLAPGAALAGIVIDTHGASPSYLVVLGAGVVATVVSLFLPVRTPDRRVRVGES